MPAVWNDVQFNSVVHFLQLPSEGREADVLIEAGVIFSDPAPDGSFDFTHYRFGRNRTGYGDGSRVPLRLTRQSLKGSLPSIGKSDEVDSLEING